MNSRLARLSVYCANTQQFAYTAQHSHPAVSQFLCCGSEEFGDDLIAMGGAKERFARSHPLAVERKLCECMHLREVLLK